MVTVVTAWLVGSLVPHGGHGRLPRGLPQRPGNPATHGFFDRSGAPRPSPSAFSWDALRRADIAPVATPCQHLSGPWQPRAWGLATLCHPAGQRAGGLAIGCTPAETVHYATIAARVVHPVVQSPVPVGHHVDAPARPPQVKRGTGVRELAPPPDNRGKGRGGMAAASATHAAHRASWTARHVDPGRVLFGPPRRAWGPELAGG
jgi:hypothetical protein